MIRSWTKRSLVAVSLSLVACNKSMPADVVLDRSGEIFASTWSVRVIVPAEKQQDAERALASIDATLRDVEHAVSSWKDDSIVHAINTAPVGGVVDIGPIASDVIARCVGVVTATEGAFDVAAAPLFALWKKTPNPTPQDVAAARAASTMKQLSIDSTAHTVVRNTDTARLDITSVGDGAAASAVLAMLQRHGITRALVDVAGEVATAGAGRQGAWRVGLETPLDDVDPGAFEHQALLQNGRSLSTSGTYRNRQHGRAHIIDARTGMPSTTDVVSCTVVGRDLVLADAWSTACILLGEADTRRLLPKDMDAFFVRATGTQLSTSMTASFPLLTASETANETGKTHE
jgi:FAD:protein FMN transferase